MVRRWRTPTWMDMYYCSHLLIKCHIALDAKNMTLLSPVASPRFGQPRAAYRPCYAIYCIYGLAD